MEKKSYTNYYGLLFNCPVGAELDGCGYKKVRQFKSKERLIYYDTLNDVEKDLLIRRHQQCLSSREKKTLFHESQ